MILPKSRKISPEARRIRYLLPEHRRIYHNYGEQWRYGDTISTAFVESTVNQVVSKRMVKKQQMHWSQKGVHLLPQVRTCVLNDDHREVFRRWYPNFAKGDEDQRLAAYPPRFFSLSIEAPSLPPAIEKLVFDKLNPAFYLRHASNKEKAADDQHRFKEKSEEILISFRCIQDHFSGITREELTVIETVAEDCASVFKRSSSCVEGRDGQLLPCSKKAYVIFTERKRSALLTTETELKLIAAAAMTGLSRMPKNG